MGHTGGAAKVVKLEHDSGYRFRIAFGQDGIPELISDEMPPLGQGSGPDPAMMLAAATGNCLASSLLFAFRKARVEPRGLAVQVDVHIGRNPAGRQRIERMDVRLEPGLDASELPHIQRSLQLFEDFCLVTQSIRQGIDVRVEVAPRITVPIVSRNVPPTH